MSIANDCELLNTKINKLSENFISVEFAVSPDRCQNCYEAALSRLGRTISLPGFRTGKIPKQVIVQQIGVARIKAAALETLIDNSWQEAITQHSLEPTSEAHLKDEFQLLVDRFKPNKNVNFTLEAEEASSNKKIGQ